MMTLTLGAVLYLPILEWLQSIVPELTYTGRTELWKFGLEFIGSSPFKGFGFESFDVSGGGCFGLREWALLL